MSKYLFYAVIYVVIAISAKKTEALPIDERLRTPLGQTSIGPKKVWAKSPPGSKHTLGQKSVGQNNHGSKRGWVKKCGSNLRGPKRNGSNFPLPIVETGANSSHELGFTSYGFAA